MGGMRIDRLSLRARGLIFLLVERGNAQSERTDTVNPFTYPTQGQLYALERLARRERAQAQARLILSAISAVKALFARAFSIRGPSASDVHRQVAHHA